MRPDGGPLAPVRVTPEDFHYVAENFVQFLQTLAQVGQQLSGQVNAAAGIAGIDEYAKDFDAQFRPVADEVFAGFDRACNLLGDISTGIDWSGVNHWRADHASVPGNNPDETPWTPASSGTYLPMNLTAPSLFGHTKFPIGVASLEQKIPLGSPSGLHALADDFGAARDQVQDLTDACHNQLETLFANNSSADLDALDEYWDRVGGASDTAILTALVRGCDQLCQSLHDYAEWMTEAMDQVIRTLADLALQAGFSFVFGLASLFSGEEEGVPVAISKLGNAIGVAKIAAAVDTAVVAVAGTALVSLGFGIDAINGAMTAAINATPNPNLDPTTPESATSDTQAEQAAEKIGDEAAPRDIPNLKYSTKQLQKKFKHAADFGVDGSWSSDASAQFEGALQRFAQDSTNTLKSGTYHGEPATLIYNSTSGLCEVLRSDGSFWTAFRMGEEQLKNVIGRGSLGGG